MSALTFRFFGTGLLQNAEGEITLIRARKQLALLAYLLMEKRVAHSRDSLMALFWGEHDTDTARNNLRVTLSRVRKLTAMAEGTPSLILANQFDVHINPDANVWLDLSEFEQQLQKTRAHGHSTRHECAKYQPLLTEAVALYQNEFLAGLALDDCPDFEEWLFMQRERQHLLALDGCADLTTFAESNGELEKALQYTRRQIELDPPLVTSRERLNVQAEDLFVIPGLSVPLDRDDPTAGSYPAVRLFVDRAYRLDKAFKLTPEQSLPVVEICQRLEGHPLGIELAATWIRDMPCDEIAAELAKGLDLLESTQRDINPQHRSLRAVFDASWRLLSSTEQEMLAKLAIFRGGFTTQSAKAVANASPLVIAQLCHKSLLRNTGSRRYDMHESVRQFATQQLSEMGTGEVNSREVNSERVGRRPMAAARLAHGRYFLGLVAAQGTNLNGSQAKDAAALIRTELDNVRASWRWATEAQEHAVLAQCTHGLSQFYQLVGLFDEGQQLFLDAAEWLSKGNLGQPLEGSLEQDATVSQLVGS